MADEIQQVTLPHMGIQREPDIAPERRRRPGHGIPVPQRARPSHGSAIQRDVASAVSAVTTTRQSLGIAPDRLLVVEFHSWDPGCRDVLEKRFDAVVVDERLVADAEGNELTHVLVQFASRAAVSRLESEAEQYRRNSSETTMLPPGLRGRFFDGLESIRTVTPVERIGRRLRQEGFPDEELFYVDVDLWHPGTLQGVQATLNNLRQICVAHQGRVVEDLRTSSLILARVQVTRRLAEALLELDIVAQVNLPPVLSAVYASHFDDVDSLPDHAQPTGQEPVVAVLDSGVLPAHPLLRGWVVEDVDFDSGENTAIDQHGHGTQVAGLVVYGDVARCIETGSWTPEVLIANAKVLRRHPQDSRWAIFPENHRPEALVERAIRHFHKVRGCRVFNLSIGSFHDVYSGGRQFGWAEVLDQLARELDVVIVVSAGNNLEPAIPDGPTTREEFQAAVRDSLLSSAASRLCNPATSAIAVVVGSIARSDRPRTPGALAGAPAGAPAPFSRVGPGYESKATQRAVKPEFVAYGGNFAIHTFAGGPPSWMDRDINLGEPTTRFNTDGGRPLTAVSGTSFAAPHVSNAAAWALEAASEALGSASGNAARAVLGVSAATPPCGEDWLLDPERKETWARLRLVGYGVVDAGRVRASLANDACLIASDNLEEDCWHVYAVPVPPAFLAGRGNRGIAIALAFDPPVRSSRREYLSRTMWLEVMKGLTLADVTSYRTRHSGPGNAPSLPQSKLLDMRPTKTDLQWSTLQVRRKTWTRAPSLPVITEGAEPLLHVLVGCQSRFPHGEDLSQGYSLAIRFWHSDAHVEIYQQIQTRVRARAVVRARIGRRG